MTIRIAINGFGRIGRMVFRRAMNDPAIEIVAVNASYPPETLAHLLKYDTVHGTLKEPIHFNDNAIIVHDKITQVVSNRDPLQLPWKELNIDVVVEATGKFNHREGAQKHLTAGARKVVITAPAKEDDITIVMGVNNDQYDPNRHHIISNASCTTNGLAPIVKVLHEAFGIRSGMMTTIHSVTNDQNVLDNHHKDLRRARACGQSIIPTSTGAAKAVGKVIPELNGKLNGMALRVPTPNVSVVDLVAEIEKDGVTVQEVNEVLKLKAEGSMRGIIEYSTSPLVSSDFIGNDHSTIIDAPSTMVMGQSVKVLAWYDNEWGYSCRVVDLVKMVGEALTEHDPSAELEVNHV
jgi:glyceraldehyde 3-phosphate dehydrogenase